MRNATKHLVNKVPRPGQSRPAIRYNHTTKVVIVKAQSYPLYLILQRSSNVLMPNYSHYIYFLTLAVMFNV